MIYRKRVPIESIKSACKNESFDEFIDILLPVQDHVYAIEVSGRYNIWVHENYNQKHLDTKVKHLLATLFTVNDCVRFYFYPLIMSVGFEKFLTQDLKSVLTSAYAFSVLDFNERLKLDFRILIWNGVEIFLKKQRDGKRVREG
jgi:hypothetical protein